MIQFSAMKGLLNDSITQMNASTNKLTLIDNQVVQGQVLKLFPDQKALIQVGQSKLVAQLEVPINMLDRYWFRVKGSEHQGLQLKILKKVEGNHYTNQTVAKDLLSMFQQKSSKENILLTSEMVKDQIPFTKDQLLTALELLKNTSKKDIPTFIEATKYAIKQEYPITENVIRSLVQAQTNLPLANQIDTFIHALNNLEQPSGLAQKLQQSLENLMQKSTDLLSLKPLELEKSLILKEAIKENQAIREMLLAVSKDGGGILKDQIDSLIQRLNGQTLLQQEFGPTLQMITQVPLFALNNTDLTIQWNGKKQKNGQIDPSFCRILFYLQLPFLKEMMVDVQIQNRVMMITITNNIEAVKPIVDHHTDKLKELLNEMGYHLSSIQVKTFEADQKQHYPKKQFSLSSGNESYTGVDVKV